MKIGHITHIYKPHNGGIENYIYRLKNYLQNCGHEVTIYTTDLSLGDGGIKDEDAIYCKTLMSPLRNPFSLELREKLLSSNEDIYHIHNPWFISSLTAAYVLKNKPKIMTVHGARVENKNLTIASLNLMYHPFAQYVLKNMDVLMPQGQMDRQRLLASFNLSPENIITIPNGIELNNFQRNDKVIQDFYNKHNLKPDSFKILYVSRIIPEKNPAKLVEAVSKYLREENVEVIMIGGGSEQYINNLKLISDKRIHILGETSQAELVAAYHLSNLFVFLGLWEGMPTVILEAMACGLPILTTPVAAIPDVVIEGENGFFINIPIDERLLADKIRYFINVVDTQNMSKKNILKVQQNYSWDTIGSKILNVYKQTLDRRSHGN